MVYLISILIYLIGSFVSYKEMKRLITDNSKDPYSIGMRMICLVIAASSWASLIIANKWFLQWAEKHEDEIASW